MRTLRFLDLEHGRAAYRIDFALYGIAVVALGTLLVVASPRTQWQANAGCALAGLSSWSLVEYALHRFVLHGMEPFRSWHTAHHERPAALIFAPTLLTAALSVSLLFLPVFLLTNVWRASAVTLGVLTGYFAYALTHHAIHHWRPESKWLRRRKRWHALHHHRIDSPGRYGVTTEVWDRLFDSVDPPRSARGQ
jgi:sterol desaturase/sphingolipid hydroxylase (fatty acid hydroxylase superfamily)